MRYMLPLIALAVASPLAAKNHIVDGMNAMTGKPVQELFAAIGAPDRQEDFLGTKVFFWEPKTIAAAVPCRLKVELDQSLTIAHWHYEGSDFACETLSDRFKKITAPRR